MRKYMLFQPNNYFQSKSPKQRWGICKLPENCPNGMVFWPKDAKCYSLYKKGPCSKGTLLVGGDNETTSCQVVKKKLKNLKF